MTIEELRQGFERLINSNADALAALGVKDAEIGWLRSELERLKAVRSPDWVLPPFDSPEKIPEVGQVFEYYFASSPKIRRFDIFDDESKRDVEEWHSVQKWRYVTAPSASPSPELQAENPFRRMHDHALGCVDTVFQEHYKEGQTPILPDFLKLGDDKFNGVVKLAKAYKDLQAENERLKTELALWKPMTPEEANAALAEVEAEEISEEEVERMVKFATDPANRLSNREETRLHVVVKRQSAEISRLKAERLATAEKCMDEYQRQRDEIARLRTVAKGSGQMLLVLMDSQGRWNYEWLFTRIRRIADSLSAALDATEPQASKPAVVCLCGSTRFLDAFRAAEFKETLAGRIVLTIGCDSKSDDELFRGPDANEIKARLDELHKRKIDLADEVLILNVGGYIGSSTRSELAYAKEHGKRIRWLEEESRAEVPTEPQAEPAKPSDNPYPKCPKCGNSLQNATPAKSPELRRCATCKHVWNPSAKPPELAPTSKSLEAAVDAARKEYNNNYLMGWPFFRHSLLRHLAGFVPAGEATKPPFPEGTGWIGRAARQVAVVVSKGQWSEDALVEAIKKHLPPSPPTVDERAVVERCARVCDTLAALTNLSLNGFAYNSFRHAAAEIRKLPPAADEFDFANAVAEVAEQHVEEMRERCAAICDRRAKNLFDEADSLDCDTDAEFKREIACGLNLAAAEIRKLPPSEEKS